MHHNSRKFKIPQASQTWVHHATQKVRTVRIKLLLSLRLCHWKLSSCCLRLWCRRRRKGKYWEIKLCGKLEKHFAPVFSRARADNTFSVENGAMRVLRDFPKKALHRPHEIICSIMVWQRFNFAFLSLANRTKRHKNEAQTTCASQGQPVFSDSLDIEYLEVRNVRKFAVNKHQPAPEGSEALRRLPFALQDSRCAALC